MKSSAPTNTLSVSGVNHRCEVQATHDGYSYNDYELITDQIFACAFEALLCLRMPEDNSSITLNSFFFTCCG